MLLCAGGSRRMGTPKGLLEVRGVPLLTRHLEVLTSACEQVAVVLGAHSERYRPLVPAGVHVVENEAWASSWPSDSLRLAVERCAIPGRCLVTPVDVAPAAPETLAALASAPAPAVPVGPDGARGHPVILGPRELEALRRGPVEGGLRTLLADASQVPVADPLVALDFDDPAAWDRVRRALEERGGGSVGPG